MKRLLFFGGLILSLSCSKKNDDVDSANSMMISLPKTISTTYSTGQQVLYEFSYNMENQIEQIRIERSSDEDKTFYESNFNYGSNGELTEVLSIFGDTGFNMNFSYDSNMIITDVNYKLDDIDSDLNIFYIGEEANAYSINGELANLPSA